MYYWKKDLKKEPFVIQKLEWTIQTFCWAIDRGHKPIEIYEDNRKIGQSATY